jgi:hypothetical protein
MFAWPELVSYNWDKAVYKIVESITGELGTTAEAVEKRLPRIFKRAFRWKAVVLPDEADILLEQGSFQYIHCNALVCVFPRTLIYYKGIMFFTAKADQKLQLSYLRSFILFNLSVSTLQFHVCFLVP